MKTIAQTRNTLLLGGLLLGATTGAVTALTRYLRHEIGRRGYPSWETCHCDFKTQPVIFQVWHSRNEQRGETIVAQEWGMYIVNPPLWARRALHYAAQSLAVLNPHAAFLERVTLSPQEAYQFASLLHATTTNEDLPEPPPEERSYIAWKREVLHAPRYIFDANVRRLYPSHIPYERLDYAEGLAALWDHINNLPIATEEGPLLATPPGTRIDLIGWAPAQIAFCTARLQTLDKSS